ncbi:Protein MON2 [Schistosoma japonicum]|uniref:Protein MON2 n=1 Tax=Schistosoma japonicum TaxID=6182 RepID=A0A4Z2D1T5_SCHJA|nr:Protein MON2 [Schistosoma japonicum]
MSDNDTASLLKFTENVLQDYRSLISETKRRFVPIKEATEAQIPKLRAIINSDTELRTALQASCSSLISPFVSGCLSKNQKIIVLCLTSLQRFINQKCLSEDASEAVIDTLWQLAESNVEEVRLLQTTILLLTSSSLIRGSQLAKAFTICLKLHLSKSPATVNTAAAAVRQCASTVFDRVFKEELIVQPIDPCKQTSTSEISDILPVNPLELKSSERDAYMLFQDICLLMSDDTCIWLYGTVQINKVLGLELIESLIFSYPSLFCQHPAFAYLLKTNLCPLVIKLFSPSLKLHSTPLATSGSGGIADVASAALAAATAALTSGVTSLSSNDLVTNEKPNFALFVRLKRLLIVIVNHYFHLLNTECEIYLSLLIRFLDLSKLLWQRALALEVLYRIVEQPELVKHICISYDMRQHATKIFQELVNAFGHYIQASLANPCPGDELSKDNTNQTPNQPTHVGGINQSMLYYKGCYFPINLQSKGVLLDMLDRSEPPVLADGYCLSLAVVCLRKIVDSLKTIINTNLPEITTDNNDDIDTSNGSNKDNTSKKYDIAFRKQIVSNSWCSLLSTFNLLLETSADHHITSSILQSLQIMIDLSGKLHLTESRDAFAITLCRSALPSSFGRSLLTTHSKNRSIISQLSSNLNIVSNHDDIYERSPVVLVVSQGPGHTVHINPPTNMSPSNQNTPSQTPAGHIQSGSASSGNTESLSSGNILLTAKHFQAACAVLATAQAHGNVLDSSWDIFLTTMQYLVWMLKLKIEPSAKLYFKPVQESNASTAIAETINSANTVNENPTTTMTTTNNDQLTIQHISMTAPFSVSSELTTLSSMLSQIFVQSNNLSVNALHSFISGLCRLSSDALEAVNNNREPSQFPIAKMTEIGLVNISRLNLWWKIVSNELLTVCNCTHIGLRQLASSCLTSLIKQAVAAPQNPPFWQNEALTIQVLDPLTALSDNIIYDDIREEQLKCVQQLLHCWGEQVRCSWLRLIEIIGVIRESYKVDLIQTSFKCFKLIVTDYLSTLLPNCYLACVETAARFGHQKQDLNIALAAIGSLLHLADFFMEQKNTSPVVCDSNSISVDLKELWISVFHKMANLCLDRRPAVRKSACQTLFNSIECHSEQFDEDTWSTLLWKILFPLLSNVHNLYQSAPVDKVGDKPNSLLIHHSRDTASKQWAETLVLTLSGVSQCFLSKQSHLLTLNDFTKCWQILLDHLKQAAYMDSDEISLASLNCMQILLDIQFPSCSAPSPPSSSSSPSQLPTASSLSPHLIWSAYWETWLQIGKHAIGFTQSNGNNNDNSVPTSVNVSSESQYNNNSNITIVENNQKIYPTSFIYLPSTSFITLFFDLFIPIFNRIKEEFQLKDFDRLAELIQIGVLTPLYVTCLYPTSSNNASFTAITNSLSSSLLAIDDSSALNSLQESVLRCLNCLAQNFSSDQNKENSNTNNNNSAKNHSSSILPRVLQLLLTLSSYAVQIPKLDHLNIHRLDIIPPNYIVFAEKSLLIAVDLYQTTVTWPEMCSVEILESIIRTLRQPMALKYSCPSQTTWILACRCFFQVITAGINVVSNKSMNRTKIYNFNKKDSVPCVTPSNHDLCKQIADTIQHFLFCQNQPPSSLPTDEFQLHEELDCKFVDLISDLFLSNPAQLPEFFISRLINLLSLGSVQSAIPVNITNNDDGNNSLNNNEDFDLNGLQQRTSVDHSINKPSSKDRHPHESCGEIKFSKGLGLAVRQMSLATSLSQDQLVNESLSWDIDLDHLRQLTFRENFARLCFGKLLSHAFSTPLITRSSSATSTSLPLENGHVENTNNYKINPLSTSFSLMVSKAAVRSILQRCRSILIKFYQASRLTGKCPLPRARSAEISYVFKALTVMLTSLQSLPIQHDVDDSIWSTVIELYPHIVDCVLVAGGSNQMAVALHHLLRLYGEFLAPTQLGPGGGNSKSKKESSSSISYSNNINSMDIANDIANGNMNQNKGSVNGT